MSSVSVLIPNYNNARYLKQCLESVRAQTFDDWEAVVGDNASTDESLAIVDSFHDRRIRVVQRPRTIGWVANVNLLLSEVGASPYVAVLHADDWWEPRFLATMSALLEAAPKSLIATCAARHVRDGQIIEVNGMDRSWAASRGPSCPPSEASRILTRGCCVFAPSVLARAGLYQRLGGYDESLPQACDWLMWLRAAAAASIEVSGEPLANYRVHAQSQTSSLARANLRGLDLVRLVSIVEGDWRSREPFAGAIKSLASTVVVELLAYAAQRAEAGDHAGAVRQARLARAVAATTRSALLAGLGETAFRWGQAPWMNSTQRRLLTWGRFAWHAVHRPASQATR